jgi:hypothetical protein
MGPFPILGIGLCLAGFAGLGAYSIREFRDPRVSRLVLISRAVLILLIIGILAFGWHMRGGV